MQDLIKDSFTESIQSKIVAADMLSDVIEQAATLLVQCLLQGNKIVCFGDGQAHGVAANFTSALIQPESLDRPNLPAILLQGSNTQISALAGLEQASSLYAEQLKTIAQTGDVFIAITGQSNNPALIRALEAAVSADMVIIAITGDNEEEIAGLLGVNDIEIRVPSDNAARIVEVQQLIAHCLVDVIVKTLFPGS